MSTKVFVAALMLAFLGLVGCDDSSTNTPSKSPTRVRLMNMVYDGGAFDLRVDSGLTNENVSYGRTGKYFVTTPGKRTISVHKAGETKAIASAVQELTEGGDFSAYCFPPASAFAVAFQNDPRYTTPDKSRLKLVNACPDGGKLELRVTAASSVIAGPIDNYKATQYADYTPGSYTFSVTSPSKPGWSIDYEPITLLSAGAQSVVFHGTLDETDGYDFGVRVFNDAGDGDQWVDLKKAESTANIAFVNALNGASAINVAVDGSIAQVQNLSFGNSSPVLKFASGFHTYSVATVSTTVISNSPILTESRKSYSVFVTGTIVPSNVAPLVLEDATVPNAAVSLMRIINLVPDVDSISFFADAGTEYAIPYAGGMKFRSVSVSGTTGLQFLSFPAISAPIYVKNSKDSTELARSSTLSFEAGNIYTLFVAGTKASNNIKVYLIKHN